MILLTFKLDDMKENISKHITYEESTHSNTAVRKGITNSPTDEHLKNMQKSKTLKFGLQALELQMPKV